MRVLHCDTRRLLAPALLLAAVALAGAGCSFADRWDRPDPEAAPREAIADVFRYSLAANPYDPRPEDAAVTTVTAEMITWSPPVEQRLRPSHPEVRSLRFADITAVGFHEEAVFDRGVEPEAIFIYLRGDKAAVARAGGTWQIAEGVSVPLGRPYLALRRRAPGSYRRLMTALEMLGFRPERY